ncbi:unnamed protein product [Orchesella dallaii]|uniref:Glycosyltransferase family 92 protein n=1 Tax=Orchesella dallaii TaxID=48710 RepID=A0ABP1QT52_9HEXA
MENYEPNNPTATSVLDKQQFISPNHNVMNSAELGKQNYYSHPTNDAQKQEPAETIIRKRKIWMRISDEVFVYSAYLDIRNSTYYFLQNNSSSGRGTASGGGEGLPVSHANMSSSTSTPKKNMNAYYVGGDSDKLSYFIVRIVGIKTVPPLREFIKKDILDWFRIKNEMEFSQKFECKLHFNGKNANTNASSSDLEVTSATKVTYTVIEEGIKVYAGCYINCYFNKDILSTNTLDNLQVALYPKTVPDYPTKLIDVSSLMMTMRIGDGGGGSINYHEGSLAACVRPLFGPFAELTKIIQFISYYHAVGVMQFTFYSMSISTTVRKYLKKLSMLKIAGAPRIILHDWNLPTGNTSELWDYGSLAALNDCLFSNMDQEFVIFVDIDEFIVPQRENDFSLWDVINMYNKTKTYQLLIRNTFFCNEFCKVGHNRSKTETRYDDQMKLASLVKTEEAIQPSVSVLRRRNMTNDKLARFPIFKCTVRTKRVWNVALRSKFIVNPRQVLAVGHHLVTKYVNKSTDFRFTGYSIPVDPKLAVMNHYRECTSISSKKHPILTRIREIDRKTLKYEDRVVANAEKYFFARDF